MHPLAILADDLTGALDCAAPFAAPGTAVRVLTSAYPDCIPPARPDGVLAVDADCREATPEQARQRSRR